MITKELGDTQFVVIMKKLLNIKLNEITNYFRVYSVNSKKLPFNELNSQGYSLE